MIIVVKYEDLKKNIDIVVSFDSYDDCLEFFSMYNPNTIHIVDCEVYEVDKD